MSVLKNPTIIKILDYYKNLWALSYASGVAHWDLETYMPKKGVNARGEALGRLSVIRQRMFLDPAFVSMLTSAGKQISKLNDQEKAIVRVLNKSLDFYKKVPSTFLEEFENLTNTATVIWREAKEKENYKIFEPALSKIFKMNSQMAEYLGYSDSPYDALLDQYEENLTTNSVNQSFSDSIPELQKLLKQITTSKKYQKIHWLEEAKYDKSEMEKLNNKIIKTLWTDSDRFRIDISSHPFTTSFGKNDTRITTWYHDTDFARSVLATVHEFGHALYDMQSNDALEMTPIAGGSNLVIHESQSRLWENHIGRSKEFIEKFLPDIQRVVGKELSIDDVYLYFNKVSPSFLRVEADEISYHLHIKLRFDIERDIIEGKIKFKDIKEVWNVKTKEYLGIIPKKDSLGILQDIHWSGGSVGYFPTYSLGTFLSAQWMEAIKSHSFKNVKHWLAEHVHQYGSTYTLQQLLIKNDIKYDPTVNIKYLQEKYKKIYQF